MADPAAEIRALYQRHAAAFARQRGQSLIERGWLETFAEGLPAAARVLDIGCGSGAPIGGWLLGRGFRLAGIDTAPALLDMARAGFPQAEWIEADMRAIPLAGPFDGLIAWHSFFHLPHDDQRAMFGQFARLAAPGARLMFTSGTSHGEAIGRFEGERLYHASLDPGEYRALLAAHGFTLLRHRAEDPECGGATVWLAERR